MSHFPTPRGVLSQRIHGAKSILSERAGAAREAARRAEACGEHEFAASLRGKARGYSEALDLIRALDKGWRLPQKPWGRRKHEVTITVSGQTFPARFASTAASVLKGRGLS